MFVSELQYRKHSSGMALTNGGMAIEVKAGQCEKAFA
jgi:hypothetical protein